MVNDFDLDGYHGSDHFYRHPLIPSVLITEGAAHLMEHGAAWLVDLVASWQLDDKVDAEDFQVWTLRRFKDRAVVKCSDGNYNTVATQRIEYTDFPRPRFSLWAVRNNIGGVTVMLPSEY